MLKTEKDTILFEDTSLSSNMEDYLEMIEILSRTKKVVRVNDIAKSLNIKMPSVTAALQKLEELDLINYERYGYIELTDKGKKIAENVYSRHTFLAEFFHDVLKINIKRADEVACRIEHYLTPEACKQIYKFLEFYKLESKKDEKWTFSLNEVLSERPLSEIMEGDISVISRLTATGPLKKRLGEMGFRKGEKIKVIKYAPLKDPIEIAIKDYNISLRVEDAKGIIVKPITDDIEAIVKQ